MSKLDELIQELCPDGVGHMPLGNAIISLNTGLNPRQFFRLNTENAENYYVTIREIRNNTIVVSDKTDRIDDEALKLCNNRSNLEIGDVLFSGTGTIGETAVIEVKPTNWNIKEGVYAIKPDPQVLNSRYLMYLLHTADIHTAILKKVAGGTVKSIPMAELKKIQIPVPPLPVQSEIVRILDNFTELTAELTARKKQYEYYRDKLLEHEDNAQSCTLRDICLSIADGDHMPPPKSDSGVPFITISNITENKQIDFSNVMYVPRAYYESLADKRKAKCGDILYTVVGSFGTPVHITDDTEFVFQRHIAILRPNQNQVIPRYMYHAMQSTDFYRQADKAAKGAAQRTIALASLGNMTIPVPQLNVQERLVHVLDNFETICSDLKIGLPAEIEARQKQYEFYRDALLTYAATGKTI
ncbi:MAG: restriction endonuclease subunit S, partial [Lachnospiraceae bacterium]|nr:restriction endonuclease subunit S [Lachnospiraceae bacterium]